jgi:alpha-tubulin suppressor-like RCC1 family protein
MCITIDGRVYVFGGNQFGQLGTGASQGEVPPTSVIALNVFTLLLKNIHD